MYTVLSVLCADSCGAQSNVYVSALAMAVRATEWLRPSAAGLGCVVTLTLPAPLTVSDEPDKLLPLTV